MNIPTIRRSESNPSPSRGLRTVALPLPLANGDHLAIGEFLVRYEAATVKKAQLIEGIVHMPSPVRADAHGQPDSILQYWLSSYAYARKGLYTYPNTTLLLDNENAPQPDAILCSEPKPITPGRRRLAKPRVWRNEDDYLCGAPELVCEIAASSSSVDMHEKKRAYARTEVSEYLVWLTLEKKVHWFALEDGHYQPLAPDSSGRIRSKQFPGLVLDVKALLKRDPARLVAALE